MSAAVESVVKMPDSLQKNENSKNTAKDPFQQRPSPQIIHKRHKGEESKNCRYCRKRNQRGNSGYNEKYFPSYKRRKKDLSVMAPTRFLLGGNIRDPLNLNSLQDEEVNRRLNAVTPETSPMPTPQWKKGEVEVLLPPNIHDPLNLEGDSLIPDEEGVCRGGKECADAGNVGGPDSPTSRTATTTTVSSDGNQPLPLSRKVKKKPKKKRQKQSTDSNKSEESKTEEVKADSVTGEKNVSESDTAVAAVEADPLEEGISSAAGETSLVSVTASSGDDSASNLVVPVEETPTTAKPPPSTLEIPPVVNTTVQLISPPAQSGVLIKKKQQKKKEVDKIVSPVIPQPGAWLRRKGPVHHPGRAGLAGRHHHQHHYQHAGNSSLVSTQQPAEHSNSKKPNFKECNKRFQYGNYNRYYGYRNADGGGKDPRLPLLASKKDILFEGKDVLDIGCNTGQVTLAVASKMGARRVVGLDIDRRLVEAARANIRHYLRAGGPSGCGIDDIKLDSAPLTNVCPEKVNIDEAELSDGNDPASSFPISMPLVYGPLPQPSLESESCSAQPEDLFPHNVSFVQGNYILGSDVLVNLEQPQFDTILCLSVTKWFHLNWGDDGIKRAFQRMFTQLKPGGCLVLEPQPWQSYKKKKNITETTWKNFQNIKFFPHKFSQFLLSEVGFSKCEVLGHPAYQSVGFQRPIRIYTKGTGKQAKTTSGTLENVVKRKSEDICMNSSVEEDPTEARVENEEKSSTTACTESGTSSDQSVLGRLASGNLEVHDSNLSCSSLKHKFEVADASEVVDAPALKQAHLDLSQKRESSDIKPTAEVQSLQSGASEKQTDSDSKCEKVSKDNSNYTELPT